MRLPALIYLRRVAAVVLVLATFLLWAAQHGWSAIGCGDGSWSASSSRSFGLLSYYTLSTTSDSDGSREEQASISAWRLTGTLLLTGLLLTGAWKLWTSRRRPHRSA